MLGTGVQSTCRESYGTLLAFRGPCLAGELRIEDIVLPCLFQIIDFLRAARPEQSLIPLLVKHAVLAFMPSL